MSVYIKGMDMPKSCEDCFCYRHNAEYDYAYCNISSVKVLGNANARLNNCPLIPVPDHGRLIDADALYEKFVRLESEAMSALQTTSLGSVDGIKWSAILTERTGYKFDVVDAPTIIPASGGDAE